MKGNVLTLQIQQYLLAMIQGSLVVALDTFRAEFGLDKMSTEHAILMTIGSAVVLAASGKRGLGPVYGGRVVVGLAIASNTNLAPVTLWGIAPPSIRGTITALSEILWRIGDLCGYFISYGIQ